MIFSCRFDDKAVRELLESGDCAGSMSYDSARLYMDNTDCTFFGLYDASRLCAMLLCVIQHANWDGKSYMCAYLCGFSVLERYVSKGALKQLCDFAVNQLRLSGTAAIFTDLEAPEFLAREMGFVNKAYKLSVNVKNDGKKCALSFKRANMREDYQFACDIYSSCTRKIGICAGERSSEQLKRLIQLKNAQLYLCNNCYFIWDGSKAIEFMASSDEEKTLKNAARFFECEFEGFTVPAPRDKHAPEQLTFDIPGLSEAEPAEVLPDGRQRRSYALFRCLGDVRIEDCYLGML